MNTVIVKSSRFNAHYPVDIPKNTVNAEAVLIRLDSEWDSLTVRIHWLNVASGVEKVVLLERDQPNTIPWEVLTELGELRMGLVGMDGDTVIKPTIWLTYGYVADGVDPESGSDPQPPTPSWEQQMVEQATAAANAAKAAKEASEEAAKSAGAAGPYAEKAQKSAETAKEAQRAASTSAQEAGNASDQANIASDTAKDHADAAGTAKVAAERAAEIAGNAQSGAALSAQTAANSAREADDAKREAQKAAAILPAPTQEDAGKFPMVNPEGNGYIFGEAGGGKIDDTTLGRDTTWSSRMIVDSLAPYFEASGPVVTCNPVSGYPLSVVSQIIPSQGGDGDPSPDNVRPILGYTEAKIKITGQNLFDISKIEDVAGKLVNNGDGTITVTTSAGDSAVNSGKTLRELVGDIPPGNYYLNAQTTGAKKYLYLRESKSAWMFNRTRSVTAEDLDSTISFYTSGVSTTATISDIYLSPATLSGPYVPYNADSKSVSVAFEDTVYGGQLNWTTGTLMVDRVCLSLTGEETFVNATASDGITRFYILKNLNPAAMGMFDPGGTGEIYSMVGNKSPYDNADENIAQIASLVNVNELRIRLSLDLDDAEKFKAELARLNKAGTPFQVCYKIAEPFAIHLTPTEILALSGVNTLYTNTGDTTLSGRTDPNEVIKGLEDRIAALQGGGGGTMDAQQVLLSRALAATCTTFSDAQALSMPDILPTWSDLLERGEKVQAGVCLMHSGQCYRVVQAVKPIISQPPDAGGMLAVYRPIDKEHAGTLGDPTPWVNGMDCYNGKYYSYQGKTYLCKQDMTPCVWAPGTAGVWQWEVVS